MIYRTVNKNEYKQLAAIHHDAFKEFFLTSLGLSFLQTYYKVVLTSGLSIAVCAVDENNKILGFSTGSKTKGNYHSKILLSGFFCFLLQALRLIIIRPVALMRLAINLNKSPHPHVAGNCSELLSIAVLPEAKGHGIGKGLLSAYEKEARNAGFSCIALTTDYENNDAVVAFYKSCGYKIFFDFITFPNRRMYKMIKIL